jgi:hypothetical protein
VLPGDSTYLGSTAIHSLDQTIKALGVVIDSEYFRNAASRSGAASSARNAGG